MKRRAYYPPSEASHWNYEHLKKIGITYADGPVTLPEFMSTLKTHAKIKRTGMSYKESPSIFKALEGVTKGVWSFSFDYKEMEAICDTYDEDSINQGLDHAVLGVEDALTKLDKDLEALETQLSDEIGKGSKNKKLFMKWHSDMTDFWQCHRTLLLRFCRDDQLDGKYTNLLMAFSRIFSLRPELGGDMKSYGPVKSVIVRSSPDIRFLVSTVEGWPGYQTGQRLMVVTEVKGYDAFRGLFTPENFTHENLSEKVRGQHGIKLLLEVEDSFFLPGIVGVICIGTQLIFTYLSITYGHLEKIRQKGEVERNKAEIVYTRPFDFMSAADRDEIYEHLFWFGFIQSTWSTMH